MATLVAITDTKDILIYEAYYILLMNGIPIDKIEYLRHKGIPDQSILNQFKDEAIQVTITPLPHDGKYTNEAQYHSSENFIQGWYRNLYPENEDIFVFIGGGHKLLSLILQRCSFLFGAKEVFHIFFSGFRGSEPKSIAEVEQAYKEGLLTYASMGSMNGWPALINLNEGVENIRESVQSITNSVINRNVDDVNEYPFECINLLPPVAIDWLSMPLCPSDREWVLSLPKVELHCHLGGFSTHNDELSNIRKLADGPIGEVKNIPHPDDWPLPMTNISLEEYMKLGDNNGSYLLKDNGCLRAQVTSLYKHFLNQNINYAEVRCSPFNYASERTDGVRVLKIIQDTFEKEMEASFNDGGRHCQVNLLIIATRKEPGNKISITNHLELATKTASISKDFRTCCVVGVDLAGFEHIDTRASYYEADFNPIHRSGIDLTIHAGENDDAEGIWEAVFKLNTRRIGHGLHLYQSKELLQSIVNRQIGIEMCPFANYQIKGFFPMPGVKRTYPLLKYLRRGVKVCANTDNIGISSASLTDNIMLLSQLCPGITRMEVLQLTRNGYDQGFVAYDFKVKLLKEANRKIFNILFYM